MRSSTALRLTFPRFANRAERKAKPGCPKRQGGLTAAAQTGCYTSWRASFVNECGDHPRGPGHHATSCPSIDAMAAAAPSSRQGRPRPPSQLRDDSLTVNRDHVRSRPVEAHASHSRERMCREAGDRQFVPALASQVPFLESLPDQFGCSLAMEQGLPLNPTSHGCGDRFLGLGHLGHQNTQGTRAECEASVGWCFFRRDGVESR